MINIINNVKRHKPSNRIKWALFLSFTFHVLLILARWESLYKGKMDRKLVRMNKNIKVEIVKSDKKLESQIKAIKERINADRTKSEEIRRKLQIVNNEMTGDEKRPNDSRFLGEKNQTFKKQTISKNIDIFKQAGKGVDNGSDYSLKDKFVESHTEFIESMKKKDLRNLKLNIKSKKTKVENKKFALSDLGIAKEISKMDLNPARKNREDESYPRELDKKKPFQQERLGIHDGSKNFGGISKNNDFIEDIPLGDVTNLNTIEFKYFGFYSRIRSRLEQHWGHSLKEKAEKLFKKGKTLASNENYITSLKIVIDDRGNILNVMVIGSSGYRDLDEAAIESFNKAGPFPNPPKGMLENGKAVLEWGFVVKS